MANWTDEQKQELIDKYLAAEPTPENSMEIVKEIAEEKDYSPNAVRMILSQAGKYVKKEAAAGKSTSAKSGTAASGDKAPRVSKEAAQKRLSDAIEAAGGEVDTDITSKLTGKAALYLAEVIEKAAGTSEDED